MNSRVLRSAVKRAFSSASSSFGEGPVETTTTTTVVTKRVKKPRTAKIKEEVNSEVITTINYYDNLVVSTPTPELPDTFRSTHDPQFIKGLEYLIAKDPSFREHIVLAPFPSFVITESKRVRDDYYYFESLISGIISQQISGKAAKAIKQRLIDNLSQDDRLPSAKIFANSSIEQLRFNGLSERKLAYVKLLAEAFDNKILTKERLESLTDEEIYDILIEYKGIGPWSVVMFLLFSLKRLNTFTHTDLGVLRGASKYLNERQDLLQQVKKNTIVKSTRKKEFKNRKWVAVDEELVNTLSKEFEPYKSCLMLVFWRMSDIDIDALETS